jgi:hypothetical protein
MPDYVVAGEISCRRFIALFAAATALDLDHDLIVDHVLAAHDMVVVLHTLLDLLLALQR